MVDVLTPTQRSRCMAKVGGKNTGIEVLFRKALWALGLRYRLHYSITGKPDIVFVSAKIAVFIDGCFWHGCPIHGQQPKTNSMFWKNKFEKNKLRDEKVTKELSDAGWNVVRFWEHEIKQDLEGCVSRIYELINKVERGT